MSKPALSTGCVVASVIGAFFVLAGIALVVVLGLSYYSVRRSTPASSAPLSSPGASGPVATGAGGASAERPNPTPDQLRAIEGGKSVTWEGHDMSWTVPADWTVQQDVKEVFQVKSPGSFDAGWLLASISPPMPPSFPVESSLDAMYQDAVHQTTTGAYTEARMLELDGLKGVFNVEAAPSNPTDVQRIEWRAYRSTPNGPELITLMAHSSGKGFESHRDALFGVLYSTKVSK